MANRYWVGGTANWDATVGTKWSDVSGGAGGFSVPTSADDVFFDAASGASAVGITATVNAKSLTLTGFTGSFSGGTSYMNIAGNVTFDTTYTTTSTAIIYISTTSSITSNGASWGGTLQFTATTAGSTLTIVDNASFRGYSNINNNVANSVNGATVYITGGTYYNSSNYGSVGTADFILTGNVTVTAMCLNDMIIDAGANTINFDVGATYIVLSNCKVAYVSGVTTNNPLTYLNILTNVILDTSLMTWGTLFAFNSSAVTLLSNVNCTNITVNSGTSTVNGLFNVNISGNLVCTATVQGTSNFVYNGTGTWSGSGTVKNNFTINTSGTLTISGTVAYSTGTLSRVAGGTVVTTGSTLNVSALCSLDISLITLNNLTTLTSNPIITLLSDLNISGNLTTSASSQQFNGLFNINVSKNLTIGGTSTLGTAQLNLIGIGTWSAGLGTTMALNTTIKSSANIILGSLITYNTGTLTIEKQAIITTRTNSSLTISNTCTLTNIDKCKFKNVTVTAGVTLTMNKFFSGSPEFKTVIRSTTTVNFTVTFTDNVPKKSYFVNVKNCTVTQTTTKNQLNIIGRDSNAGFNTGIIFGESGMEAFPLNQYPTENSYPTASGFLQGGMNN